MLRIASGTTDQYIFFDAGQTGLSSFTVERARNTPSFTAMTTPTVTELGSTGVYGLLMDEDMTIGAGNVTEHMVFRITHAGMSPVLPEIELFNPALIGPVSDIAIIDGIVDDLKSGIILGSAVTGTLTTTVVTTDLTGYGNDQLIGRVIIWLSGNAEGEAADITDYAATNGTITFAALTTAPGNGDLFKII